MGKTQCTREGGRGPERSKPPGQFGCYVMEVVRVSSEGPASGVMASTQPPWWASDRRTGTTGMGGSLFECPQPCI